MILEFELSDFVLGSVYVNISSDKQVLGETNYAGIGAMVTIFVAINGISESDAYLFMLQTMLDV